MSRIELTDSPFDMIVKMCEGNPGAMSALMDMIKEGEKIDPQGVMGGIGSILLLDTWEIYGTDIYILWSDKCQRDCRKFLMILRACQMGNFPLTKLKEMAADQAGAVDLTDAEWQEQDDWLCENLVEFQKP
jgi:hypothetical protein